MTGETYEQIRLGLGLSQVALARRLQVSRTTIHMRESGKTPISREAALALEQVAHRMGFELKRQQQAIPAQSRNDPCACGSGRKFKKCCGR